MLGGRCASFFPPSPLHFKGGKRWLKAGSEGTDLHCPRFPITVSSSSWVLQPPPFLKRLILGIARHPPPVPQQQEGPVRLPLEWHSDQSWVLASPRNNRARQGSALVLEHPRNARNTPDAPGQLSDPLGDKSRCFSSSDQSFIFEFSAVSRPRLGLLIVFSSSPLHSASVASIWWRHERW